MSKLDPRLSYEPDDRLTRICSRLGDQLKSDPEYAEGDRLVVMMSDANSGGVAVYDYDGPAQVVTDVMEHIRALLETQGIGMQVIQPGLN